MTHDKEMWKKGDRTILLSVTETEVFTKEYLEAERVSLLEHGWLRAHGNHIKTSYEKRTIKNQEKRNSA